MNIAEVVGDWARVTITLFIVLDPIGLTPLLYSITARMGPRETNQLIFRVIGGATVLLLFFTATGTWLLSFFGVTLTDLRIGGGLLLLIISLQLVLHGSAGGKDERERGLISEGPFISPLLIGPGAITASVVLATDYGVALTSASALAAMGASLVVFLGTRFLHRLIGDSSTDLITRILGVLIAAVGISYIRVGVMDLISGV